VAQDQDLPVAGLQAMKCQSKLSHAGLSRRPA
jgi:hypothetical protein